MESFSHFEFGKGHITLSLHQQEDNLCDVGVAFCSPTDQFSRKEGRVKSIPRRDHRCSQYNFTFKRDFNLRLVHQLRRAFWQWLVQRAKEDKVALGETKGFSIPRWVWNFMTTMSWATPEVEEWFVNDGKDNRGNALSPEHHYWQLVSDKPEQVITEQ